MVYHHAHKTNNMSQFTKYYLYKLQRKPSSGETWEDVIPNQYSIDGDGTKPYVVAEENSTDCGYKPSVEPIYRWYQLDPSTDWICDEPSSPIEPQYRWIESGTPYCVEYNLTQMYKRQVSNDGGLSWTDVTPISSMTSVIQYNSENCGYVPPSPSGDVKFYAVYNDSTTYSAACDSSTTLTTATTKAHSTPVSAMTHAEIGSCVTSLGVFGFSHAINLASVTIPSGLTSIGQGAFWDCSVLTSVTIPNSVTTIGKSAFMDCNNLTSVTIPSGVTSIAQATFSDCYALTSVTIPNSVTSIGDYAFMACNSLTSVTIPSGVTSIGDKAFNPCDRLTSVIIHATTPPTLEGNPFVKLYNTLKIYVPSESVDVYKSASTWGDYTSFIQAIP